MPKDEFIECPICFGTGSIDAPKPQTKIEERVKQAKSLKKSGFSFREIMKIMEYKSTRSVSYLLNKKSKK